MGIYSCLRVYKLLEYFIVSHYYFLKRKNANTVISLVFINLMHLKWRRISLSMLITANPTRQANSNYEELTHLERPWCWERLKAGGEGNNRGWNVWMASPTQLTWIWVNFGSWWWTGRPGVLRFMGSQRVGQDWATELYWVYICHCYCLNSSHPLLPPVYPQVHSLCLHLHPFPVNRLISTIFLDSIYMHCCCFWVTQSYPALCNPMDWSMTGFSVLHHLPVCSDSCPLSQWCHPNISSSVAPFSFCLQSFPTSGSFSMSQFFTSGGQSIGTSASTSVLAMNIQDWFPLGLTGWISLQSKGLSRVFSSTTVLKHQFFGLLYGPNSHVYTWLLETP